ncbi:MAG: hypothetical protein KJN93_00060 [Alphaproteobacteria bacterium]|nr:hypothetical protein [Alphaproteobacteria bacterium]NNF23763.1 hypothetical protein [Paracoccaceae bacterium]
MTRAARLARARLDRRAGKLVENVDIWRYLQKSVPEARATLEQDVDVPERMVKTADMKRAAESLEDGMVRIGKSRWEQMKAQEN